MLGIVEEEKKEGSSFVALASGGVEERGEVKGLGFESPELVLCGGAG